MTDVPPVHRIVYISTAVAPMTEADLMDLLVKARAKNADLDITGTLVYEKGHFFQVLEGEAAAVKALFETIKKDERHRQVRLLIEDDIETRQFGEWSMAWSKLNHKALLTTFVEISKAAGVTAVISPDHQMIRRFVGVLNGFL